MDKAIKFFAIPLHDNRRRGLRNIGKIRRHRLCKQHIFIFRAADLRVCNMARYRNGDNLCFKQPQTAVRSPVVVHAADAFGILYFSVLAVKYFNIKIALFWCAAFACSLAIGNIIFPKRHTRLFVALFIIASAAFITADAIMINGVNILLILCESALCIAAAILISRKIKSQS